PTAYCKLPTAYCKLPTRLSLSMHIAILCRGLGAPGAVASIALRQARELTRHARITLVSDSFPDDASWAEQKLVRVPNLNVLRRFRHVPDEIAFARVARRVLRSLPSVDFILAHAHSASHLGARGLGIPFGFFVHGDIFARPKGTYDARLTAFYRWIAPRAYASADVVFALAPYLAEMARERGARNVAVVPNGIDLHDLGIEAAPSPRPRSGALRMISVGRLSVEKGIEHLLAACRLLDSDVDYELTIAGSGPLEADLRAAAADLPRVRFPGAVPRASLGALYGDHDLFVTATLNEAFALVVLEALACGLPVIGTSIDALRAVVHDGENGLLVPPTGPRALADAITRLARDESFRMSLASRAHDSVLPRYGWTAIGDEIASIISRMRA
ncbi:MAG: glycosyltransferase family 4 protein, partial [Acidobacteriota bacterium]|nr:glycosyltransferase family 4 protein [Acidobacteriota bacterium]